MAHRSEKPSAKPCHATLHGKIKPTSWQQAAYRFSQRENPRCPKGGCMKGDHSYPCPRCTYDLSGEVARWNDEGSQDLSCPCYGTCPECGVVLQWHLVLRPELATLRWFIECTNEPPYARKRFAGFRTFCLTLAPWRFWNLIRLETPGRSRPRLWWFVFALLISPLLANVGGPWLYAIIAGLNPTGWFVQSYFNNVIDELPWGWRHDWYSFITYWLDIGNTIPWIVAMLTGLLTYPLVFLCFPWTRKLSKVSTPHIWRAGAYAAAPLLLVATLYSVGCVLEGIDTVLGNLFDLELFDDANPYMADYWGSSVSTFHNLLWPLALLWFPLWWACATRIGFRMKDWKQVTLALTVPSLVAQCLLMHTHLNFSLLPW